MEFYTNNKEKWKDIEGYEGLYKVSDYGRIISTKKKNGYKDYLIGTMDNKGYCRVTLNKDAVSKTFSVHRLVAQAFLPNPENKPCIDHIDTNPSNNRVENLRWVTHKENMNNPITKINKRKKTWREKSEKLEKEFLDKVIYCKSCLRNSVSYNHYKWYCLMWDIEKELKKI